MAVARPFFHEFVVRTPRPAAAINAALLERGIIGGYDLARIAPELERHLLLCATEMNDRAGIDALVSALAA
jgi:glycine dehydrogenase subunit 1